MGACALACGAPAARAGDGGPRAIASAFEDAPLVLHVRDASELRKTEQFKSLIESLRDVARFEDLTPSWSRLSDALGWDENEAFDRLLGESFALIIQDIERPDAWTIVCEVSDDSARHIRHRLRVVPKSQVGGVPVFGVEGDRVGAATVRAKGSTILLLTPDHKLEGFERAIRLAGKLDEKPNQSDRLPEGQIALAMRGLVAPDASLGASASRRKDGWRISVRLRSPSIADMLANVCHQYAAPAIDDDLLFQARMPTEQFARAGVASLAVGTRVRDDRPGLDEFGPVATISGRSTGDGDLAFTVAVGVTGRHRSAAKVDAIISALIARLGAGRIARPDFDGLYPDAMRVSETIGLDPLVRGRAAVSWALLAGPSGDLVVIDAAPASEARSAHERIEHAKATAGEHAPGEPRAYASAGWVRLRRAIDESRLARELVLGEDDSPAILRTIELVAWRVWRDGPDVIRGEFDLDLTKP